MSSWNLLKCMTTVMLYHRSAQIESCWDFCIKKIVLLCIFISGFYCTYLDMVNGPNDNKSFFFHGLFLNQRITLLSVLNLWLWRLVGNYSCWRLNLTCRIAQYGCSNFPRFKGLHLVLKFAHWILNSIDKAKLHLIQMFDSLPQVYFFIQSLPWIWVLYSWWQNSLIWALRRGEAGGR